MVTFNEVDLPGPTVAGAKVTPLASNLSPTRSSQLPLTAATVIDAATDVMVTLLVVPLRKSIVACTSIGVLAAPAGHVYEGSTDALFSETVEGPPREQLLATTMRSTPMVAWRVVRGALILAI